MKLFSLSPEVRSMKIRVQSENEYRRNIFHLFPIDEYLTYDEWSSYWTNLNSFLSEKVFKRDDISEKVLISENWNQNRVIPITLRDPNLLEKKFLNKLQGFLNSNEIAYGIVITSEHLLLFSTLEVLITGDSAYVETNWRLDEFCTNGFIDSNSRKWQRKLKKLLSR